MKEIKRIVKISGHLTQTEKKHIRIILNAGLESGKINRKNYFISKKDDGYQVIIKERCKGIGIDSVAKLRSSTHYFNAV